MKLQKEEIIVKHINWEPSFMFIYLEYKRMPAFQ